MKLGEIVPVLDHQDEVYVAKICSFIDPKHVRLEWVSGPFDGEFFVAKCTEGTIYDL